MGFPFRFSFADTKTTKNNTADANVNPWGDIKFPETYTMNFKSPASTDTAASKVTSTPMPSINTNLVDTETVSGTVIISYKLFGDINPRQITLKVYYKARKCSHLYAGNANEMNTSGTMEVQGETDWNKLQDIGYYNNGAMNGKQTFKFMEKQ